MEREIMRRVAFLAGAIAALGTCEQALADALADRLDGIRITIQVACEDADPATLSLSSNAAGHAVYGVGYGTPRELVDGRFGSEYESIHASAEGNRIRIRTEFVKVPGASNDVNIVLNAQSCSATHQNVGGPLDTSCRATRCSVATVASRKPQQPTSDSCNPQARVESRSEGSGSRRNTYEIVVADNDCPFAVRFERTVTTRSINSTKTYPTGCVPAKRSKFEMQGDRTSSSSDTSMTVSSAYRRCQ